MRSPLYGICCLCGSYGKLSFEHSPPSKAFNDDSVLYSRIQDWLVGGNPDALTGETHQRGVGAYTLCESCNTKTGSWYGGAYVELAKQGMQYLERVRSAGGLHLPFRINPLRVIKQVICMLACASGPQLRRSTKDRPGAHSHNRAELSEQTFARQLFRYARVLAR